MRKNLIFAAVGLALLAGMWCVAGDFSWSGTSRPAKIPAVPAGDEVIMLGAGCFWHAGDVFEQLPGVVSVTAGYMGGTTKNPTYEQVCTGKTGHGEVSRVVFDPKKIELKKVLQAFWKMHDPTQVGSATGRSAIYFSTEEQHLIAEKSKSETAKSLGMTVMTEIAPAKEFIAAEEYHQDYYKKHGVSSCKVAPTSRAEAMKAKK